MNKKIEKEFWIDQSWLDEFCIKDSVPMCPTIRKVKKYADDVKVKLSWEEPEKTVTLSESMFDHYLDLIKIKGYPATTLTFLKMKEMIFGGEK